MFHRTQRLFLRPPFPEDWRQVYRGINHAAVVRMLARAPWPYLPEDAQDYCATLRDSMDLRLAITLPDVAGAPVIGQIGLDCGAALPEVGYWITPEHQGQGYATEALRGVLEMARMLGVARVEGGHYLDNPASGAVLRKAGFIATGEVRPTHALGRGGEMVLSRRYVIELATPVLAGDYQADSRKPA